jgi:hypothetical protein
MSVEPVMTSPKNTPASASVVAAPSPQRKALYQALLQAQGEMGPVKKDKPNPAFRSNYATLVSVLETIAEPLQNAGLILYQPLSVDEQTGSLILETIITHVETGESIVSRTGIVCADPENPQKIGGAITYFRRYSILALLNLAPEDDDGNAASTRPSTPKSVTVDPKTRLSALLKDSGITTKSKVDAEANERFGKAYAQLTPTEVATWLKDIESTSTAVPF